MARQAAACSQAAADDPAADLRRERAFAKRVDERAGRENPALRMSPAQQRFGADHGAVAQARICGWK